MTAQSRRKYYRLYSFVFVIIFILCFGMYLFVYKKAFFRSYDGFDQHYISFMYLGHWGRSIVKNLFQNHQFSIPLWNQAIGYGADIPTSLAAYLWDPFNWISFFIPAKYAESGYAAMIILKFYACGIAYSVFALHRKHPQWAVLCGAVIYTFSAVNYVGFYQSFFINPLIIFPLLIMGADRLFEEKKSGLYVAMLAISLASYFYFAYMMCILIFLYCIVKICFAPKAQKNVKNIVSVILRFLLYSVIAAGISAVSLVPSLIVMLQAGRLNLPHYLPLFFNKSYYAGIVTGWTTYFNMLGRDCNIGWGVIAFVCAVVLFLYKGNWQIKTEFILMTAGLCIPFVGHIMNGMSYTTNRWVWAYDLVVALIVTMMVPKLKELSWFQLTVLLIASVLYIVVCRGYFQASDERFNTAAILILLITGLCFIFPRISARQFQNITTFLSCVCVVCMAFFTYSKDYGNAFDNNINAGTAYDTVVKSGGLPLLSKIDNSDDTRFDSYGIDKVRNSTWLYGVSGINFYISVYNNNIDLFHSAMALNTGATCYSYSGLDRRSELEALMGVNHYFVNSSNICKPVGYTQLEAEEDVNGAWLQSYKPENDNSLFYKFDKKVSYDEFNELNPIEKQEVLMQACVVDSKEADTSVSQLDIQASPVHYSITSGDGVTIDGDVISVANDGGQVELRFPDLNTAELYLYFDTISYENGEATGYSLSAQGYKDEDEINNLSAAFSGYTWFSHLYGGKSNWLLNFGEMTQETNRIVITFENAGTYTIRDIQIYTRPLDQIQKNIENLQRVAQNIQYTGNRYECDVDMDNSGTLFTSIPYSTGWTAYDNAEKIAVNKTDVAFMSFELAKGNHHIELIYRTPGLYAGVAVSIFSLIIYKGMDIYKAFRLKRNNL